jgi:HSP20 family protein
MKTLRKSNQHPHRAHWYPTSPWNRFFRNDFLDLWDGDSFQTTPSINISEEKDHYEVELAAPGMKKEDFNVDLEGNLLTISCENETETGGNEEKQGKYSRREYNYSSFSRSFTLPDVADTEKIDAKYTDGILHLRIPKRAGDDVKKNRRIDVK